MIPVTLLELPSFLTCKNMHMLKHEHEHIKHMHRLVGDGERKGETEAETETETQRYPEKIRHALENECGLPKKSHS